MASDRLQRRMAAILAADVVGYSRLMGEDEEATLATLKSHREVIDQLIATHGGRVFGSAGDSVIAEFASPVEAVRCATEIQLEIDKRNVSLPERSRMRFRIGINLGDVVVDGDNLMGDGVNVAARLEALASPGGMCISEAIHSQVRDRLSLDFLDLGEHAVKNIARPVRAFRVPLASEEQVKSPFRGLDVFEFENADLFFGRARAIATCTARLEHLAANGKAFLLIYGMSGSGKSSLLRAGLLPSITRPGAVAGIKLWRRCVVRPSEGVDAIASLVTGLLRDEALPELAQGKTPSELATIFSSNPDQTLSLLRQTLGKAAHLASATPSQARLILAIDQLEELFTTEHPSRAAFVPLLTALAGSGLVWVIGTIRGDFFHRCSEIPGFSTLKDGLSSYELLPPAGPEIAQIIREPARTAGLRFEETTDQGRLDDVLQKAAAADPGSLPLLQFVLEALYEVGKEHRLLTFAAYRALGGLEGAIARRADEVIGALPSEIQDALPAVLRALTTVRPGDEAVTVRPALLAEAGGSPARLALVDALITARLLVSDENAEGGVTIRVAHEALLSRWPRARDIINANRRFLETRARLQSDTRRWVSENKNPELLLPAGKRLAEGEELLLSRREEVGDQIIDYINTSSLAQKEKDEKERQAERTLIETTEAAKRERLERESERRSLAAAAANRLARRTRYAAMVALLLALVAGAGAFLGLNGQKEARRQATLAELSANQAKDAEKQARLAEKQAKVAEEKAIAARDDALRNQSLSLSFLSQQTAAGGDTEAAILLALEALPKSANASDRPYLPEAEAALYKALFAHRLIRNFQHEAGVTDAEFNRAGDRLVTSSFDKTARVWNIADGSQIASLTGHQASVERAMFSPDGRRVVTASRDGSTRIWDATSGKEILRLNQPGEVHTALFSPDGTRVLTASEKSNPVIWDANTGIQTTKGTIPTTQSASFSPDGGSFAASHTADTIVQIWNTETGKEIKRFLTAWSDKLYFSPDGKLLLITAWILPARLWDLQSGAEIASLRGHKSDLVCGTFSHDGHLVATASFDGAARLWDALSGKLLRAVGEEISGFSMTSRDQELVNCAFSPDDNYLVTASAIGKVSIWNVQTGSQLAPIRGDGSFVEHVEFNPVDGNLVTASHDGFARLWDVDGILTTSLIHKYPPTFAVFSPDNVHLLTGGGDSVAHLWDTASGREIGKLNTNGAVQDATFSPDGARVATSSLEGQILIWSVATRREILRFKSHPGLLHIRFSPDGNLLESGSIGGISQLWDAATGAELGVLKTSASFPYVVFSPDGHSVLAATNDNIVRLLKRDGTERKAFAGHQNRVSAAAFSPDGQLIVTGSIDRTARIWSIKDGSLLATLKGHGDALTEVAFSPNGQSLLTASRDGTTRIWNVSDGKEKVVLRGHGGGVSSAQFSPNGAYVVTASSRDRTVRLWSVDSGREIAILASREDEPNRPALTRATFNSDGTRIVIISGNNVVQIARVFPTPQGLIDYAKSVAPRGLTPCERQRFFLPVEGDAHDCPS